jgi:hypothetical protein
VLIDPEPTYRNTPLYILVAGADAGTAATTARRTIEASGARVGGVTGFGEAAERLGQQVSLDGVMVVADTVDLDLLDRTIDGIELLAREREARLIAQGSPAEIDLLWSRLSGQAQAVLLDPSPTDLAAALSLPQTSTRFHDVSRDEEERMRLLDAEIARFAQTLVRLSGREGRLTTGLSDTPRAFPNDAQATAVQAPDAAEVRAVIRARRLRDAHFPSDLFADPAWDMLLDLYAAELEHRRVSVSSLCIAAAVPGTTALRWIGTMVGAGLFERQADQHDRRRAYVALTSQARRGLGSYFAAIRRAGLNPA